MKTVPVLSRRGFVAGGSAYDAGRDRQASVRVLSSVDLGKQIGSDGATWLDRRLIRGETADLAPVGYGQKVREAIDQRREHHIEQRAVTGERNGRIVVVATRLMASGRV